MSNEVLIHSLKRHQRPVNDSAARFKVLRCGRRWGKDMFAQSAALIGHGPVVDNQPIRLGLAHGKDIVWMAPTIPQAAALWKNEVEPRFRNLQNVAINKVEKTVTLLNPDGSAYATLWVRSAEAITSIRGIGAKLGGVIINEAAWLDLEYVWRDVLRPALMDCGGWAIIMSTTNADSDGHENEAGKRSPSFFNILCEQVMLGERDSDWAHFYGTAADNPLIKTEEFEALVREYPSQNDPTCQQEVFANLIAAGAGVAFPEWNPAVHVADYEPAATYRWSGGGDWGYMSAGALYLMATGPERSLVRYEFKFREIHPYKVGYTFAQATAGRFPLPEWIAVDTPAVSDGAESILDRLQAGYNDALDAIMGKANGYRRVAWINPPKGPGSRVTKKLLLHAALKYVKPAEGPVQPWAMPALQFHSECPYAITTIMKLPLSPKNREDVDTKAEDHGYDGVTSWLMAGTPDVERKVVESRDQDTHPGFENGQRKDSQGWRDRFKTREEEPAWSRHSGFSDEEE